VLDTRPLDCNPIFSLLICGNFDDQMSV